MFILKATEDLLLETAAQRQEALVNLISFLPQLLLNTIVVWIIVHFLYYPKTRNRSYYFTYMLVSTAIFVLLFMVQGTKLQLGAALGLFAVFGILRYRTDTVPIREMTYMFYLVALSVANGTSANVDIELVLAVNALFLIMAALMELTLFRKGSSAKIVKYDNIDLIRPEKRDELIADLEKRLGFKVVSVEVGAVDFLRDFCVLKVHYSGKVDDGVNTVNELIRIR